MPEVGPSHLGIVAIAVGVLCHSDASIGHSIVPVCDDPPLRFPIFVEDPLQSGYLVALNSEIYQFI